MGEGSQAGLDETGGGGIEKKDFSLGVGHHDAIAHAVENGLEDAGLPAQGGFGMGQLNGALFGGGAAVGHALFQGFVEELEGGLGVGAFADLGLQGGVGAGQFAGALLDARFQFFVGAAQGLLDPFAFGHFGGEHADAGVQAQALQGIPEQEAAIINGTGVHILGGIPDGAGEEGDKDSRPATGEPGDKTDGNEIKDHQRDHRAGDVIQQADEDGPQQSRQDQGGAGFSIEIFDDDHRGACYRFWQRINRTRRPRQGKGGPGRPLV